MINEIIFDFDEVRSLVQITLGLIAYDCSMKSPAYLLFFFEPQLLNEQRFSEIEKIKTIGSTYMAASGLSPDRDPTNPDIWSHLCSLAEFALAMKETIEKINIHSFNNFRLRIGKKNCKGLIGAIESPYGK